MTGADSLDTELKGKLVKSSTQVELESERPYVKKFGEEKLHISFEKVARLGQFFSYQNFHDVCEIVRAMEANPGQLIV